jgi:UPF0176 protein
MDAMATSAVADSRCLSSNWSGGQPYTVILFYRYVNIIDVQTLIAELLELCQALGILGRTLIASEGINGTLAGSQSSIDTFIRHMRADARFSNIDWKTTNVDSGSLALPFLCLSIRETKEIISSGRSKAFISDNFSYDSSTFGGISGTGEHLAPAEFHEVNCLTSF